MRTYKPQVAHRDLAVAVAAAVDVIRAADDPAANIHRLTVKNKAAAVIVGATHADIRGRLADYQIRGTSDANNR